MGFIMGYYILAIAAIIVLVAFLKKLRQPAARRAHTPTARETYTPMARKSYTDRVTVGASRSRAAEDRRAAIDWARRVMENKSRYVILDTETTGLDKSDEIVQLAIINLDGNIRFNEKIKPTRKKHISQDAVAIHGLTMKILSNCRTFAELAKPLGRALGSKTVIAYNREFDIRMYAQTYKLAGGFLHRGDWECIMLEYAKYVGEWNDYYQSYRWQKLPGGEHSALGDCLATLRVLRTMATTAD